MDQLIEFMKMLAYLGVAFGVLAWLGSGQKKRRAAKQAGSRSLPNDDDELVDDMGEIGAAGGLLGGEMEDVFVGRFALRRAKIARKEQNKGK